MHSFQDICSELGVPLNQIKTIGPTTHITFLGLEIDTLEFLLIKFKNLNFWYSIGLRRKKSGYHSQKPQLAGLIYFGKAIKGSPAFNAMSGARLPRHHIRITKSILQDMSIRLQFLNHSLWCCLLARQLIGHTRYLTTLYRQCRFRPPFLLRDKGLPSSCHLYGETPQYCGT